MRLRKTPVNWPRRGLGLVLPAALALTGATVLASGGPALAKTGADVSQTCTDTWTGLGSQPDWTMGANWSTGKPPTAASDVCITSTGDDVQTTVSIKIHSLTIGEAEGIALEGTQADPVTATVATSVDLTPGEISRIDMTYASIDAVQINDQGGTIFTDGTSALDSPDVVFGDGGSLDADGGTLTLTGLPQLSDGTLSDAHILAGGATVVLPGDVTHLVSSDVIVGPDSAIDNPQGHAALGSLASVDAASSLSSDSDLPLRGSLVARGDVSFDAPDVSLAGTYTQAAGTLSVEGDLSATQVLVKRGATMSASDATLAGSLVNDGTLDAGALDVSGDYTQAQNATLDVTFGAPVAVAGTAALAGTGATVEELPETGDSTQLITFRTLTGNFTRHGLGNILGTGDGEISAVIVPQIAVPHAAVSPGAQVTVNGASFGLGTVNIYLDQVAGTPIGQGEAGYGGRFTTDVTIPATTTAGLHKLIAVGVNGGRASATITVS